MSKATRAIGIEAPSRDADDLAGATDSAPRFRVEMHPASRMKAHRQAWAKLCGRALEPNIFLDPAFMLPLAEHVKRSRSFEFLVVWQASAPMSEGRMVGLLPVRILSPAHVGRIIGFRDDFACLGTPLLDAACGQAAFAAMLDWLAAQRHRPVMLTLTSVPADGAFMREVIGRLGDDRTVDILAAHRRAVLRRDEAVDGKVLSLQSAKSRKERKRQRRRLAEQGLRAYVSARTPEAVAAASEVFLDLERKGWKGERRTALLADPATAAFARAMIRETTQDAKCRIDALELNGSAVAMGIVLSSGDCAYFWKTAFDEDHAALSPGVQFAMDLADAQLGDPGIAITDSCAVADHPMIDRLWPDRLRILDIAIALKPGTSLRLSLALKAERTTRTIKSWAKDRASRMKRLRPR